MGFINYASAQNVFPTAVDTKVGIGTTNPTTGKLVINTGVAAPASALDIRNNGGSANNNAAVTWAGGAYGFMDFNPSSGQGIRYSALGPLVFGSNTNAAYGSSTFTEAMRITATSNVGIGTTAPFKKLHVSGGTMALTTSDFLSSGTGSALLMGQDGTSGNVYSLVQAAINGPNTGGTLALNPNGGNVAVGTVDPKGYKFAVNGSAIATSMTVKVNSAWPDYVFKKDYKLPTLTEVKDYIEINHHLPDMPSEKEVIANGLNLGEMNKILTQKVEELTLYLIEQNKEILKQNKEMLELKERLTKIEKNK